MTTDVATVDTSGEPIVKTEWDSKAHAKEYAHIQRVVCAAIMSYDGDIVLGIRHFSPDMRKQLDLRVDKAKFLSHNDVQQGFVDQWGNFLTREEAWIIADRQGQIVRDVSTPGELFSENLY